jgi:cytochrome c biogenesis protein CcdA
MEFLQTWLEHSEYGVLTALLLGLMTAISPCPLATNISAIGFISRNLENRNKVFLNGIVYTLGRTFSYTLLGVIIYFGASQFSIARFVQSWGEKLLGPALIIIGLFMLDFIKLNIPGLKISERMEQKSMSSYWSMFLIGVLFALAFCPYSGVLYFGMLMPLTVAGPSGLFLPLIFAIATGLPVIIFAWLLAYAVGNVAQAYNRIKTFEHWFRRVVAVLFIGVGIYFVIIFFF